MSAPALPPVGPDMRQWGQNLTSYLRRTMDRIRYYSQDDIPAQNGTLLWDEENGHPIVAKDGVWASVALVVDVPTTASDSGTAGQIAFDASYIYVCTATDTWKRAALSTW